MPRFEEDEQFALVNRLTRHGAWRPAIEEQRVDGVLGDPNVAPFRHTLSMPA
jgi:hypothetical protein